MTSSPILLFIGCGNMGASIIGGALAQLPGARIVAVDPDPERARTLLPPGAQVELCASPVPVKNLAPDLVVLGVKPQVFGALDAATLQLIAQAPVVSIMAGIPLARLVMGVGHDRMIRVMPNLPALVGEGMSIGCHASDSIAAPVSRLVETLFGAIGRFEWVADEAMFECANPVFSCGPGFIFAIAEQMTRAGVAAGLPEDLVDRLVRQTFLGSAVMLARDTRSAEALKRAVTSPNGTTQAGLGQLEAPEALPKIIPATLRAAYLRALELAEQT